MSFTLTTLIEFVTRLIATTIPIAVALALLFFFWGLFKVFGKTDSVEGRSDAQQTILWSLIALFIIVSLGGIIAVFTSTFPDLRPR